MSTVRAASAWVVGLALGGCDSAPARPTRPPRPIPRATPSDAGTEGNAPRVSGAVPEAVARCVAGARAATPDALRGALELLDEPSLLDSACRLDLAPRLRSPDLCLDASLSSIREVCLRRAAMTAGSPERCPRVGRGAFRDPVCVAVAARDMALCAAAGPTDRATCEALGVGDASRCTRLDPLLRAGCEREVGALRGLLPVIRAVSGSASRPSVATLNCGTDGGVWSLAEAQRGVVMDALGAWALLPSSGRWPAAWSVGGDGAVLALRVPVAGLRSGMTTRADAVLELPRLRAMRTDDGTLEASATLRSLPSGRGGRARAEVRLSGVSTGVAVRCTAEIDAFVRDVVPSVAMGHHPDDAPMDR